MKRVALLHYAYPPNIGGVELLMAEQARILTDLGYKITILTGDGQENDPKITLIKLPELQSILNTNPKLQEKITEKGIIDNEFYQAAEKIEATIENQLKGIDTVIVHNMLTVYRNLPFIYAFHQFVKKYPSKKIIVWVHDHMYVGNEKIRAGDFGKTQLEKELLTKAIPGASYVVISETFKRLLLRVMKVPLDNIQVIPDGVNLKKFLEIDVSIWQIAKKYDLLESFPFIFSPVNILERKNIEYSLEIIYYLKNDYPKIRYLISGQPSKHRKTVDYLKKLELLIDKLKIGSQVIFLGKQFTNAFKDSEIHDLYTLADLIFYFSKSENFGLPILEAVLTKTPIFVSNLKVFHEVGQNQISYIDYQTTPTKQAAEIVKKFIEQNKLMKINYHTRTNYDLESIIKKRLLPLL